ncbi:MAG: nitroreductase family protein [Candidatus Alcyoniella australis]|nr:nitroreductase family protein [Candidatus Alcyoniella australis]
MIDAILSRRSIRHFDEQPVDQAALQRILQCARYAPSGMNNQPWRFAVITDREKLRQLAQCTKYAPVLLGARAAIAVFLDSSVSYSHLKDAQAVGACCQNMLLAAHAQGLGAVWLGEILNHAAQVGELLGAPTQLELMAVIALGHPAEKPEPLGRLELEQLVFARF